MYIKTTNSTNTLLKELMAKGEWPEDERFLRAGYQTAGRGQTGNGWESEEGKNLLCSVLIKNTEYRIQNTDLIGKESPFYLNVAVSVAVHRVLQSVLCQRSGLCSVLSIKWPNDIYWQDKKVAGILIENVIVGNEVQYSIAGIGLNVNQTEWQSGAPNPVSLKQIRRIDYDIEELMYYLMDEFKEDMQMTANELWDYYKQHLYRREGYWPFVEREVSIAPTMNAGPEAQGQFMARIADVLPTGEILLEDEQGKQRKYHFKQVRYVI